MFPFKLKWIATGTGHCGTGYVSLALTKMGILCGHEKVIFCGGRIQKKFVGAGPRGRPWKELEADSSWGFSQETFWSTDHERRSELIKGVKIIHVVRHPVMTIESLWNTNKKNPVLYAALAFVNRTYSVLQNPRPVITFKIEDGPEALAGLVGKKDVSDLSGIDTKYNSHVHHERKFGRSFKKLFEAIGDDPVCEEIWQYARKYGYETDC